MKYWEAVLHEVVHKGEDATEFRFTNLGENAKEYVVQQDPKVQKKAARRFENYWVGGNYPGIYFTLREAQCMALMLGGHTMQSAGEILNLSSRTVEFYLKNMKLKLNCKTKSQLIRKVASLEIANFLETLLPNGIGKNRVRKQ